MFARRIKYSGYNGKTKSGFIALIELVRRKGGNPTGFVLYSYTCTVTTPTQNSTVTKKMIRLPVRTAEEAIRQFWFRNGKDGEEFPNRDSKLWEKTTFWLHAVAISSRHVSRCTWMRVSTPVMWGEKRHKRKQPLKIGNISHILIPQQMQLRDLERKRTGIISELHRCVNGEGSAKHRELSERIEVLDTEIYKIFVATEETGVKMRHRTYQLFPGKLAGEIPWEFSLVG